MSCMFVVFSAKNWKRSLPTWMLTDSCLSSPMTDQVMQEDLADYMVQRARCKVWVRASPSLCSFVSWCANPSQDKVLLESESARYMYNIDYLTYFLSMHFCFASKFQPCNVRLRAILFFLCVPGLSTTSSTLRVGFFLLQSKERKYI